MVIRHWNYPKVVADKDVDKTNQHFASELKCSTCATSSVLNQDNLASQMT